MNESFFVLHALHQVFYALHSDTVSYHKSTYTATGWHCALSYNGSKYDDSIRPLHHNYLCQGWGCAINRSVCVWAWLLQHYHLISLKLAVVIGPTNRKNWLTFGRDPDPDMDSGSLFHFPHHSETGDCRRFISISHAVTGRLSWHWCRQGNESTIFWRTSGSKLIQKSGFESPITFGWG